MNAPEGLDIRAPIGGLFTLLGLMLAGYGLVGADRGAIARAGHPQPRRLVLRQIRAKPPPHLGGPGDAGLRHTGSEEVGEDGHGSILASERMASLIDGSCGTDAISRLSASPMPGTCAPASRRGGAISS